MMAFNAWEKVFNTETALNIYSRCIEISIEFLEAENFNLEWMYYCQLGMYSVHTLS